MRIDYNSSMGRMLSSKPQAWAPAPTSAPAGVPSNHVVTVAPLPPRKAAAKTAIPQPADPDDVHQFRKIVVFFSLAALFVKFTVLSEVFLYITRVNSYMLYWTVPIAIVATLLSGGLRRTLKQKAARYFLAFYGCMIFAVPFSFWPGDSARFIFGYGRTDMVFLIIAGGLAVRWSETRALFYTMAAAAVVNLLTAQFFMDDANGRISLKAAGTIGNSNDLAAHLLLVLPFLLFVAMDAKRWLFIRVGAMVGIVYGLWIVVGTASRAAVLALLVALLFILWHASPSQRVLALVGALILTVVFVVILPGATLGRLSSLVGKQHLEADESEELRSTLFTESIQYTFQHPLVGVGPSQFANFEGKTRIDEGLVGMWHSPHCSFTQISSECGIPAVLFYMAGLGSALLAVRRAHRRAQKQGNTEIKNACFCFLLGMIAFLVAIAFLPFGYNFYFPTMVGLAGTVSLGAMRELDKSASRAEIPRFAPVG